MVLSTTIFVGEMQMTNGWRQKRGLVLLGFIFLLITPAGMFGQENTGTILGIVTDETGATVPDARVEVSGPGLPRGMQTKSESNGEYQITRVPIGTYSITITKTGFSTLRQQGIEVRLGSQISFNGKLAVGQVSQVVEVQDSAISIDPTSSRTSTNIGQKQFTDLPKVVLTTRFWRLLPACASRPKAVLPALEAFR
ncbi:MAG: carboxypeptidase-like regulatory domain-containing protein [Bryobacteraceae bacterium]